MEDEEMLFDHPAVPAIEPATRKFSRLKRAQGTGTESGMPAQQQVPSPSAFNATAGALSDRTNTAAATEQNRLRSPRPSPAVSPGAAKSPSSSPKQSSPHASATSNRQTSPSASEDVVPHQKAQVESDNEQNSSSKAASQNDYWDSEDELEAELTRRERAEGFHADSATSSGPVTTHTMPSVNSQCLLVLHSSHVGWLLRSINTS